MPQRDEAIFEQRPGYLLLVHRDSRQSQPDLGSGVGFEGRGRQGCVPLVQRIEGAGQDGDTAPGN